ncbi:MAG: sensor histidine kinase [Phycisphaeraceae bacterium]
MGHTQVPSRSPDLAEVERLLEQFAELETELQHIRAELTHSHRLATLGTLTSTIAHEYNNILTPVVSYAQLALANPDDPDLMRKAVEKALAGAQRAAQISSSLLGFARDEADAGPAELRAVVDEALACLARPPEKDGIRLHLDVPAVQVNMSALNLQQVLMNLILNARKAMHRTGGELRIHGRVDGDHVKLDVADTGPGIPPAMLHRLFEPFATQPHEMAAGNTDHDAAAPSNTLLPEGAAAGPEKSTGLGLCICRDLLRQARGEIDVTSTPGHGATFHLTIPLVDEGEIFTT